MASYAPRTISSWFGPIVIDSNPDVAALRVSKVRGRRRYYRALRPEAATFCVHPEGWYDFMHWHADWPGLGNRSWKERSEHLRALFIMFERLTADVVSWPTPHQVWLRIDATDSSQDAVFLHTPNPNANNFPNEFPGVEWDARIPDRLKAFMTDPSWQFGRRDAHWTHFFVRPRIAV
jgi:hypothetical protein